MSRLMLLIDQDSRHPRSADRTSWWIRTTLALGLLTAIAISAASAQLPSDTPAESDGTVAARFLNAAYEPLTRFRAVRHLEARNERFKKHGWLDVLTELSPEDGFTFEVVAEGGSAYIRKKILLPILDGERAVIASGDPSRSALTTRNYVIAGESPAGSGLVRLNVKPLREETTLIDGALYVSEGDADLVRIEGRLARSPSFWTKRVDIVRHYGRVAGFRVPLSMESVAHVRLAGRSELTMTYRYEMVNGRSVEPGVEQVQ